MFIRDPLRLQSRFLLTTPVLATVVRILLQAEGFESDRGDQLISGLHTPLEMQVSWAAIDAPGARSFAVQQARKRSVPRNYLQQRNSPTMRSQTRHRTNLKMEQTIDENEEPDSAR